MRQRGEGCFALHAARCRSEAFEPFRRGGDSSCSKQWGVALGDGSCARGERVVLPYMLPGADLGSADLPGREVILLQLAAGQWGVALGDES